MEQIKRNVKWARFQYITEESGVRISECWIYEGDKLIKHLVAPENASLMARF